MYMTSVSVVSIWRRNNGTKGSEDFLSKEVFAYWYQLGLTWQGRIRDFLTSSPNPYFSQKLKMKLKKFWSRGSGRDLGFPSGVGADPARTNTRFSQMIQNIAWTWEIFVPKWWGKGCVSPHPSPHPLTWMVLCRHTDTTISSPLHQISSFRLCTFILICGPYLWPQAKLTPRRPCNQPWHSVLRDINCSTLIVLNALRTTTFCKIVQH